MAPRGVAIVLIRRQASRVSRKGSNVRTTGKGLVLLLAAMLSISALFAVACGGGSGGGLGGIAGGKATATASTNNDNESDSEATSESDNSDSGSTVSKTADDYASKVCNAVAKYATDIQDITNSTADMEDPAQIKDLVDQMVPLFSNLSKDLNKIKPPSEVNDWHAQQVTALSDAADIMSQMSAALDKPLDEAMTDFTDLSSQMDDLQVFTLSDLPDEYQTAFDQNSDCQDLQDLDIFQ